MQLLVIEDDSEVTHNLLAVLSDPSFQVTFLSHIEQVDELLKSENYAPDLILLDRMIGDSDLVHYLDTIKEKWPYTKILILSAIDTPLEKANAIENGADDYLAKPYSKEELIARIRALHRRVQHAPQKNIVLKNVTLRTEDRILEFQGKKIELSLKENDLLKLLFNNAGKVFAKDVLFQKVWKSQSGLETNTVETTIVRVRRKLEEISAPLEIKNMRFAGYWLEI